ncbi:MAG: UvrD-helicase domain-containing protein, partial [Actinomycetia bacterium]|nr:UvrD-helicase domain-containing protein [Actinomycetes bacterium]
MPDLNLTDLNPAQLQAVLTTEGPLLVLAGAGSGKTRVLTYRIAHLVENLGVSPYQILAITFTNKAATEMRQRLERLLSRGGRGLWALTFHAMAVRLLRRDARLLGYSPNFSIYDDYDSQRLMREIYSDLNLDRTHLNPALVRDQISKAKNELISVEEFAQRESGPQHATLARIYTQLQERLQRADAMDFDDLLFNAWRLLKQWPELLATYQQRFRYILVDEYQDTNHAQYELVNLLAAASRNLMVVGDDDQSIYSWRGADLRNILGFERDYPDAQVVKLEQNYRSTANILKAANAIIAKNPQRKAKQLYCEGPDGEKLAVYLASDERDEGRWIASEVEKLHHRGRPYADCAVFYRTNAQSRVLEDMLLRAGVPYRIVGGTRFFDRAEIRDVMSYLKLVVNPADEIAAKRIINVPRRGLGDKTLAAIDGLAIDYNLNFLEACEQALTADFLSKKAREALVQWLAVLQEARRMRGALRDIVEMIVERSGYLEALAAEHSDEANARIENILEFIGVAAEYAASHDDTEVDSGQEEAPEANPSTARGATPAVGPDANASADRAGGSITDSTNRQEPESGADSDADPQLIGFMEWLALRSDLDSLTAGDDYVTLMTVHSAKGLEFPVVFIAGMEEGLFPHIAALDNPDGLAEERRLAYVAITRARELLYLTHTQIRNIFGSTQVNAPSTFLFELPADCLRQLGVGSSGFRGVGWEKRGDRRGIYGSGSQPVAGSRFSLPGHNTTGTDPDTPDGPVYGSGRQPTAAQARRINTSGRPTSATELLSFAVGDRVDHKVFGLGRVVACEK